MTSDQIQIPEPQLPPLPAEDPAMTFFQHVNDLRSRLLRAILGLIPAVAISWFFKTEIKDFLVAPLQPAWGDQGFLGRAASASLGEARTAW
ncbi:MAG: hypothetical protein JRH14_00515 [Deltaproteobacteria bacterium]|nr:hypothetical protein [Deltaproteobacteria bacterium]